MESSPEEVLSSLGWTLYRDFILYTSLLEAKPGYKTFQQLLDETRFSSPVLTRIARENLMRETIKKDIIDDPTGKNEKIIVYSILPKGEQHLETIKKLYKVFTGKELEYTKSTPS